MLVFAKKSPRWFLRGIMPAQLLGFSTSSSAATIPITMEFVTENLKIDNEISSCSSIYSTGLHIPLDFTAQLTIVLTSLLTSIRLVAVLGAGVVMLVIILESIEISADKLAIGLALVFAIYRPLDMCRTVVNLTGDSVVSVLVAKSMGKIKD